MSYTDHDVQCLVRFVQSCQGNSIISREVAQSTWNMRKLLEPFDPDTELRIRVNILRESLNRSADDIIAAVREHDRKQG